MSDERVLGLEELLALHPWPPEHAAERRLEWLWHFDVAASPDALWRVIADSSRMNRALRVSEMKFEDRGGVRRGSSQPAGVRHEWTEVPWSWVAGQWITSVRLYDRGFSKVVYGVFRFEPIAAGTRLYVYFGAIPRGLVGKLALRFGFPSMEGAYRDLLPKLAAEIGEASMPTLVAPAPPMTAEAEARLASIREGLLQRGLDRAAIDRLVEWIRSGDEQDLYRIQMRERARAWGVGEDALLRVCLYATRAGLLELSWDIVCPHCRGVTEEKNQLGGLTARGACDVCEIDFGTDAAEAVEVTFHVHPSIRAVERRTFCSAEPATKDHIRVQRVLAPGKEDEIALRLGPGRYRLRIKGEKRYGYLDVSTGGAGEARPITWRASEDPAEHATGPEPSIRLVNDTDHEAMFVIEVAAWSDVALRPGRLLSFQEFRDLFGEEYLGAEVQLAVGEQTILFTDMVGSTAMYASRGDPAAFVEVKRHFGEVFAIIGAHRGAVVKTIGDAVMGAFNDPLDALKASRAIHDRFHETRGETSARLRISLHTGPCIAVKLNTDIDYFGHTVNIAAKLQALAETWQIAMSQAVFGAPGVAEWLRAEGASLEDLAYSSKAIPEPIPVKRWTVHETG